MNTVIQLPARKKGNNISLTDWLDSHAGCNVDKMMAGDETEKRKSERHFEKETMIARSKLSPMS